MEIRTRYNPATDTAGSSITARGAGRQLTIPYPHEASDAHETAARALLPSVVPDPKRVTLRLLRDTSHGFVYAVEDAPTHDTNGVTVHVAVSTDDLAAGWHDERDHLAASIVATLHELIGDNGGAYTPTVTVT